MDVQALAARIEIHEVLARYALGVDTKDWDLWKGSPPPTRRSATARRATWSAPGTRSSPGSRQGWPWCR